MRVAVDALPLNRSGEAAALTDAVTRDLISDGADVVLFSTSRIRTPFGPYSSTRIHAEKLTVPGVRRWWRKVDWPPAEMAAGQIDAFWSAAQSLPPLLLAAGVHAPGSGEPDTARAHRIQASYPGQHPGSVVVPAPPRPVFREVIRGISESRRSALKLRPRWITASNVGSDLLIDALRSAKIRGLALIFTDGVPKSPKYEALAGEGLAFAPRVPARELAAIVKASLVHFNLNPDAEWGVDVAEACATQIPTVTAKNSTLQQITGPDAVSGDFGVDDLASLIVDAAAMRLSPARQPRQRKVLDLCAEAVRG